MSSLGGFLAFDLNNLGSLYHDNAFAVNTGRNAFEYILRTKKYKHIYIPYFTCDAILEPLKKTNTRFTFYYLNENFLPKIDENTTDAVLYTNYFGLMQSNIEELHKKYENLIVDSSQSFYDLPQKSTPTFYSPRKFFGLADGGFVYCKEKLKIKIETDTSHQRIEFLFKSLELEKSLAYQEFLANEKSLEQQPIKKMSILTQKFLKNINFESVKNIRRANFQFLHNQLGTNNQFTPYITTYLCPMVYPYFKENNNQLRNLLIENNVYIPTYWPNVSDWVNEGSFESKLTKDVLPIPIDQRYNESDLSKIVALIKKIENE